MLSFYITPAGNGGSGGVCGPCGTCVQRRVVKTENPTVAGVLTPACLSLIGRSLIRQGELVFYISVDDMGKLRLLPCSSWDVTGEPGMDRWLYRCNLAGPSRTRTFRQIEAYGVIHCQYAADPSTP